MSSYKITGVLHVARDLAKAQAIIDRVTAKSEKAVGFFKAIASADFDLTKREDANRLINEIKSMGEHPFVVLEAGNPFSEEVIKAIAYIQDISDADMVARVVVPDDHTAADGASVGVKL